MDRSAKLTVNVAERGKAVVEFFGKRSLVSITELFAGWPRSVRQQFFTGVMRPPELFDESPQQKQPGERLPGVMSDSRIAEVFDERLRQVTRQ